MFNLSTTKSTQTSLASIMQVIDVSKKHLEIIKRLLNMAPENLYWLYNEKKKSIKTCIDKTYKTEIEIVNKEMPETAKQLLMQMTNFEYMFISCLVEAEKNVNFCLFINSLYQYVHSIDSSNERARERVEDIEILKKYKGLSKKEFSEYKFKEINENVEKLTKKLVDKLEEYKD